MTTTPLTTSANVKSWLGLAGTEYDSVLARLITAASAFIETWLSRTIAVTSYTRSFNGNGGQTLFLPHRPVTEVSALSVNGTAISAAPDTTSNGYVYDSRKIYLRGYVFDVGFQNVSVTYKAGLASTAPTDVPADLEQACLELIALKFRRMEDEGLSSKAMAGETTAFVVADMPKPVATLLQQYRNVVPKT